MSTRHIANGLDRRSFLKTTAALGGTIAFGSPWAPAWAAAPLLTVDSRTIEVNGKAAKVFGITGPNGKPGIIATEGDRLKGTVLNASSEPLQLHWHGQVKAPANQDRARPDGTPLAAGQTDTYDFELTPGTQWMHSHSLTEQQMLAAPLITRERDAGDVQDVLMMLHDFAFRSPQEILSELGGNNTHSGDKADSASMNHGAGMPNMPAQGNAGHTMGGMGQMGGMGNMMAMTHANDVRYDAYLANDRTLDDPEVVKVDKGGRVRLRIINGATATAFFVATPGLKSKCIAVDGSPCQPIAAASYPIAQGQRLDLLVELPPEGGAFPVLAQVEGAKAVTGIVLAAGSAQVSKLVSTQNNAQSLVDLTFESQLRALAPLTAKTADKSFMVMLGEEAGYRWTINDRVHGQHTPFEVRQGERVEMTFMNPTSMMHPMHLHGHHFQVVGIGGQRFSGAVRDTLIVPAHAPITVAFDANLKGSWFLHCHHLYHMATGMMTEVRVA